MHLHMKYLLHLSHANEHPLFAKAHITHTYYLCIRERREEQMAQQNCVPTREHT
jgi:hypothetical protein